MNLQPPDNEDPRDEAEKLEDMTIDIAKRYAKLSGLDYAKDADFEPHEWVIQSMCEAFDIGEQRGRLAAIEQNRMALEAIEETYRDRENSIIESTLMAAMEAMRIVEIGKTLNTTLYCTINLEAQRTIHDRWTLKKFPIGETAIKLVLESK